ncbi:ABC-F family ATP-binding cassette domain-containing protein [Chondromyces apiculatus]|uniref:ATPase component of ABC transporter n=1 Tax=Chondromyces apiculatus DSM 436 TaxID=1192034 RepID=A0A017TCH8_9BACT|nr:ABC-F family ATP-binding cassette domain-containing protein [Chondromyces apiculatus]EYF06336.1 ATPase component of ABC transporter [Chondromyces apiculatus DSM 436]
MPVVTAQDLRKSYGARVILDGVTATIRTGERVGLVGINGSGKSTLARILAGVELPDSGAVMRRRGAEVAILTQDPELAPDLSARDTVLAGLGAWHAARARHDEASRALTRGDGDHEALLTAQSEAGSEVERLGGWDVSHQVDAILGHVGITRLDAPVGSMSGGDRRRVALARILVSRPALAVLDEPSNHLDAETVEWLEQYLIEEHTGALLLITHDRYLLDRVAERTFELDKGKLYIYEGGYEEYLEQKAERLALVERAEANRQNFLRTELEWLRRQPKARTGKQKARIGRAESAKGQLAPKAERAAELQVVTTRSGRSILEIKQLGVQAGDRWLARGVDFVLTKGERVGVVGRNGTGKTTLLRAILDELPRGDEAETPSEPRIVEGEVVLGKSTSIAYFDQHRSGLDTETSILENVAGDRSRIPLGALDLEPRVYLERFLFEGSTIHQPVSSLSGGERARVALAKMLSRPSNVLLLDEPTNDLDVATLSSLEQMLVELEGSAIVVTHDRWFLNRVATTILAFEGDGRVIRYAGNFDAFRAQKAHAEAEVRAARPAPEPQKAARPAGRDARDARDAPRGKALTYAETKELDGIMEKIEQAEGRVSGLETTLADPALYATRGAEVAGLLADVEKAKAEVTRLTARWEELEAKREAAGKG